MNIGQFEVSAMWTKLEDIIQITLIENQRYLIQNKGFPTLRLCESATQPTNPDIGFVANTDDKILYTCKAGEYLWVKAYANTAKFNIAEGE